MGSPYPSQEIETLELEDGIIIKAKAEQSYGDRKLIRKTALKAVQDPSLIEDIGIVLILQSVVGWNIPKHDKPNTMLPITAENINTLDENKIITPLIQWLKELYNQGDDEGKNAGSLNNIFSNLFTLKGQ